MATNTPMQEQHHLIASLHEGRSDKGVRNTSTYNRSEKLILNRFPHDGVVDGQGQEENAHKHKHDGEQDATGEPRLPRHAFHTAYVLEQFVETFREQTGL